MLFQDWCSYLSFLPFPRDGRSYVDLLDVIAWTPGFQEHDQGNQSIYLYRSGPLLENGLDRPKNRYGRYGFLVFTAFPYLP